MKYKVKSNAEIGKLNQGELLIEYMNLRKTYDEIEQLRDHIRRAVDAGYAREFDAVEYDTGTNPYDVMDKVVEELKFGLQRAKKLRGHAHVWVDRYGDGRDLSCVCSICGCSET